jgi:hypothetical protein
MSYQEYYGRFFVDRTTNSIPWVCFKVGGNTRSLKPGNCHVRAKNPQCQTKNVAHDNRFRLLVPFGDSMSVAKVGIGMLLSVLH